MLKYEKIADGKYKIFVNYSSVYWIIVERKGGIFHIVDDNMTNTDCSALGFDDWSDEVEDLDNGWSDESQCFGMSIKLKWKNIVLEPEGSINAKNIDELCGALEHINICAWCPWDI